MRRVKLLALLVAFFAAPSAVGAQGIADAGIGFFGGVAMPMGEFGDDDTNDEESGYAKLGFMVGADAHLPLGSTPLGWVTTVSVNTFGFDAEEAFGDNVDGSRYWLIPVMTGISYPVALGPSLSLLPMAQVGLNTAIGPSAEADAGGEMKAKMSFSFAFSAGATLNFTPTLGVTARYVNGGAPERELEFDPGTDQDKDSPMSWIQLGVVWTFR